MKRIMGLGFLVVMVVGLSGGTGWAATKVCGNLTTSPSGGSGSGNGTGTKPPLVEREPNPDSSDPCRTNPFRVYTSNHSRTVPDLELFAGVGQHRLSWSRTENSRFSGGTDRFGHSPWRHSYDWEMADNNSTNVTIYYPSGWTLDFTKINDTDWVPRTTITDRLYQNGNVFTLQRADGLQYQFTKYGSGSTAYYLMEQFTDSQGNVYTLTYNSGKRLTRVTEPGGRYLEVLYQPLVINKADFTSLARITTTPVEGWTGNVVTVTNTKKWRFVRYVGRTTNGTNYCHVAEVEFYGPNNQKLTGAPFGVSPADDHSYTTAFDGNTGTYYECSDGYFGFCGLDFGPGSNQVSNVRYCPAPGMGADMLGGQFEGSNIKPVTMQVISEVRASDGRSVQYHYDLQSDPALPAEAMQWVLLTSVTYPDGTTASYTHTQIADAQRPLLATADDPKYPGSVKKIALDYFREDAAANGQIRFERGPYLSAVLAELTCNPNDGHEAWVKYGNGAVVKTQYGAVGDNQPSWRLDGLGKILQYTYNANGQPAQTTDALGRTTAVARTAFGNVTTNTLADGSQQIWVRNALDLPLSFTDELGRTTTWTRDASNRVTRVDYPDTSYETFAYNRFGQVTTNRLRNGGVLINTYDSRGLLIHRRDAEGAETSYSYHTNDLVSAVTDARGNTTAFEYDLMGRVTKTTNADTSYRQYFYDTYGNLTNTVDELGHSWPATYDEFNRVLTKSDPLGRTTTYSYDLAGGCACSHTEGKPTAITLPSGKRTELVYDLEWHLVQQTVGAGTAEAATTTFTYDAVGNVTTNINPLGQRWVSTYDSRNRRVTSKDPLGNTTAWSYDAVGNTLTVIRPDNGLTTNAYDVVNRLVWTQDPKLQVTTMGYDFMGNMVALTDARTNTYSFTYDLLSRRTSMVYPDNSHEDYDYDEVGNLLGYRNRAGNIRAYTYDQRNREVSSTWDDGVTPAISRSYDAAGRLLTLDNGVAALSYSYDVANQLVAETQAVSGQQSAVSVSYSYDLDGNRQTLSYPSGTVVSYGYTARQQLASVTADGGNPLAQYGYDLAGNRTGKALENGTSVAYAYDNANRLLAISHLRGASVFAQFNYTLNSVGNRTSKTQTDNTGTNGPVARAEAYGYDAVDQITGVAYSTNNIVNRSVSYQYDPVGNRQQVQEQAGTNAVTTGYSANALNQYTVVGADVPTYDANGNLTGQAGWTYAYDAQNRLVQASSQFTVLSFQYDARNRCVRRTTYGALADSRPLIADSFLIYDSWNLIEERDATGTLLDKYIHGANVDEILVRYNGGEIYYHHDGLGSVTHLTDATGSVVESYQYDVYGAVTILAPDSSILTSSAFGNRFMFTGAEYITEIGLYNYRNRFYTPALGRFLQTDPMRLGANDVNLYRYVGNNPVDGVDPLGLCKVYPGDFIGPIRPGDTYGPDPINPPQSLPPLLPPRTPTSRGGGGGGGSVTNPSGHGQIVYSVQFSVFAVVGGGVGVEVVRLDSGEYVTYGYVELGGGIGGKGVAAQSGEVYNVYKKSDYEGRFNNISGGYGIAGASLSASPDDGGSAAYTKGYGTTGISGSIQYYHALSSSRN